MSYLLINIIVYALYSNLYLKEIGPDLHGSFVQILIPSEKWKTPILNDVAGAAPNGWCDCDVMKLISIHRKINSFAERDFVLNAPISINNVQTDLVVFHLQVIDVGSCMLF